MKPVSELLAHRKPNSSLLYHVKPDDTVFDALKMLADYEVGALMVMEKGQLVGIISERDYTRKIALKGKSSKDTPVHEIVSTPVISATPEHTVEDCMRLMTSSRVRHLPVLDGDRVVGVVTIS